MHAWQMITLADSTLRKGWHPLVNSAHPARQRSIASRDEIVAPSGGFQPDRELTELAEKPRRRDP